MTTERFLNPYHNASTAPSPDVPPDLASFMLAADPVLAEATELARVLAWAHQGAATQLVGDGWDHARKYFSLSEKYAKWADYQAPAKGFGIHAHAHEVNEPIRLTDEELRAHGEWRNFGHQLEHHPPMRGWLAVPIIGSDGVNYGFLQVSDRLEGDSMNRTRPISSGWQRSRRRHSTRSHRSICPTIDGRWPNARPDDALANRANVAGLKAAGVQADRREPSRGAPRPLLPDAGLCARRRRRAPGHASARVAGLARFRWP